MKKIYPIPIKVTNDYYSFWGTEWVEIEFEYGKLPKEQDSFQYDI